MDNAKEKYSDIKTSIKGQIRPSDSDVVKEAWKITADLGQLLSKHAQNGTAPIVLFNAVIRFLYLYASNMTWNQRMRQSI